jgi:hypothetical protein
MAGLPSYPDTGTTGQDSGTPRGGGRRAGWPLWRTAAIVMIGPRAGFGVFCPYAAAALATGFVLIERRDT